MGTADFGICPSGIILVRIIVGISNGTVIPTIRSVIHQTEINGRSSKIIVERPIHIISVVPIDISGMVIIESPMVVVYVHSSKTTDSITVIIDIYIADLNNAPVIIVINGYVLYLDHRPIIVILGVRAIVETGIKGHSVSSTCNLIVDIKIEFPIRVDRKGHAILDEYEGVVVSIGAVP